MSRNGIYRDPSIVTSRPVVPGPIAEYSQPWALTAGSQINEAANGGGNAKATPLQSGSSINEAQGGAPWPGIINGAVKFFNSWRPNALRNLANHNVAGNWGSITGLVNFGARGYEFDGYDNPMGGVVAGHPFSGGQGGAYGPEYNTLIPIIYGLRVLNPNLTAAGMPGTTVPNNTVSQFTEPTQFSPTGTAILNDRGAILR